MTARTASLLVVVALVVSSALVAGLPVAGATTAILTVDDDGDTGYQTISGAVSAASAGDTIRVRPGTYEERVVVNKRLRIVGAAGDDARGPAPDAPVVRSADAGPAVRFDSGASGTTFSGFVVEGNLSVLPRGSLQNLDVTDNRVVDGYAVVRLSQNDGIVAADVSFERNVVERGGVVVRGTANNLQVSNVAVSDNSVSDSPSTGIAVDVDAASATVGLSLTENDVSGASGDGVSVALAQVTRATLFVEGNHVTGSGEAGVALADSVETHRVYVRNNRLADGGTGIALRETDRVTAYWVRDNAIVDNDRGARSAVPFLDVRENYWGAPDGPSSATSSGLADPITAADADGGGDSVPQGRVEGVSSVRFDPYRSSAPTVEPVGPPSNDATGAASFEVEERVIAATTVEVGEPVTAIVTVTNTGGEVDRYDAILTDDRQTNLDTSSARVSPGETRSFVVQTTYDSTGERRLFVRGNFVAAVDVVPRTRASVSLTETAEGVDYSVSNAHAGDTVAIDPQDSVGNGDVTVDSLEVTPAWSGAFSGQLGTATDAGATASPPTGVAVVGRFSATSTLDPDDVDGATVRMVAPAEPFEHSEDDFSDVSVYRHDPSTDEWHESAVTVLDASGLRYEFEAETDGPGTFALGTDAPAFRVTAASLPTSEAAVGDVVPVRVTVENVGRASGTANVTVAADGVPATSEAVPIDPGIQRTVEVDYRPQRDGDVTVTVDGVIAGNLSVSGDATTTDGTTTADGTTATDGTTTGDGTDGDGDDTTTADGDGSDGDGDGDGATETTGPGFGVLGAVGALALASLLARRRCWPPT